MSSLSNGLYVAPTNTKIPAVSLRYTLRVNLTAANTALTLNFPAPNTNPVQITTPSPITPGSQPQQGLPFFVTQMIIRSANGNLSGSGATGGGTVSLINTTQSNAVVMTYTAPTSGTLSPAYGTTTTLPATPVIVQPLDQLAVVYTPPTGATGTATGFTVDVVGYWSMGL
jgi:hypothetical protein